jgi:concentrative nucleoside transporter, CNT family
LRIEYFGVAALLGIAFLFSERKRSINLRIVASAFALQAGIAFFVLRTSLGKQVLTTVSMGVQAIMNHANTGIEFLFGDLSGQSLGFIFAIKVLPVIIFVSSLMATLYYLRIMQYVVLFFGGILQKIIGTSRVESLCAAANIFVGPIEAPLVVRPYLNELNRPQMFTVMAVGLSSVAGAIMLGYASIGIRLDYLVAAAFMSAPGGLLMAKMIIPESKEEFEKSQSLNALNVNSFDAENRPTNVIEAAADGAISGVILAANIGGMLIAFVALISLMNGIFSFIGGFIGHPEFTLDYLLGLVFSPLMLLLGIPWEEAITAGNLVGQKTILNEFIAFVNLAAIKDTLSEHTTAVLTFALCGFANLNALAIVFGGLGAMIPARKSEIAQLGIKAVLAAGLSNLMSAALASVWLAM